MKKLHLLLAEWRFQQQILERRAYWVFRSNLTSEPENVAAMFPFLDDGPPEDSELPADADDHVLFTQAAAVLGAR